MHTNAFQIPLDSMNFRDWFDRLENSICCDFLFNGGSALFIFRYVCQRDL